LQTVVLVMEELGDFHVADLMILFAQLDGQGSCTGCSPRTVKEVLEFS
jgi:hypothetical protein